MSTLPLADARAQLSKLIDEATTTHERFEITRNGRRAAVLMSADDYDTMLESLSVMSDSDLLNDHADGQEALATGAHMGASELAQAMRDVGRDPK